MSEVNQSRNAKIKAVTKFMIRGDTAEKWEEENPILAEREPGVLLDAFTDENGDIVLNEKGEAVRKAVGFKIGDGVTAWNKLPLYALNADQTYNPESENAQSGLAVAKAIKDKPSIFTGTEISIESPRIIQGVSDIVSSGPHGETTIIKQPYKIGDLYLNTDEGRLYQCFAIDSSGYSKTYNFHGLNYSPDITYDSESDNAQSGLAVAEAIRDKANKSDVPKLFVGTEISGGKNGMSLMFAESGGVYLKYKVGDLYFNTNERRCYQCVDVEFTEGMIAGSPHNNLYHRWIGLNYQPDTSYNPKSFEAQSGIAVEEAISNKANLEAIVLSEPPTIESVIAMSGYEFHRGKFYYNGKYEENGILFDCFIDEKQAQPLYLKFTTEISELFEGCLVEIEFDENEQFNPVILNFTVFKDLSDKADIWEVKSLTNNSSSAIKNTLSGNVVRANDVSPLEHDLKIKLTSDTITDFSGITVSRYGKNLIPYPYTYTTQVINGVTLTDNGDGTITANGTATGDIFFTLSDKDFTLPKGENFLSGCPSGGANGTYNLYAVGYENGTEKVRKFDFGNGVTFVSPIDNLEVSVVIWIRANTTLNNLVFKPQIEFGTTATEFEKYKVPQTVSTNADETVKGLTSISPNMTLLIDSNNAVINLTYNADTKAYIDNKFVELAATISNS